MTSTALITGVCGQDGYYLAQILLRKGYDVIGTSRQASPPPLPGVKMVQWDVRDEEVLRELIKRERPAEIYNFAAYSSGAGMFEHPVSIGEVNGLAVVRILEAICALDPSIRFCQASSSELFGEPTESPQSETTAPSPRSPYGAAKLYAHSMINIYRRRFGLFACSAIMFNHESPRRTTAFVTRKVTQAAASISRGLSSELVLGNLEARRDWGFARDYVHGAWLMLQASEPDDYVLATGETHSVRDLCRNAFEYVGLDYRDHVREDASAFRPSEPLPLTGDASKARDRLNWMPRTGFPELVQMMVDADLKQLCGDKQDS